MELTYRQPQTLEYALYAICIRTNYMDCFIKDENLHLPVHAPVWAVSPWAYTAKTSTVSDNEDRYTLHTL